MFFFGNNTNIQTCEGFGKLGLEPKKSTPIQSQNTAKDAYNYLARSDRYLSSTHILEVAEELLRYEQIAFKYLKTHLQGKDFRFDYRLQDGVSNDRIGLWILEKEGVFDLFKTGEKPCSD